jgi:hypothetical protein
VRVVLRATDGSGDSGVAAIQYSLDHGKVWLQGSSFTIPAPADHADDGIHAFLYRATDNAGDVEAARRGWVGIDTRRPTPIVKWAGSAVRGSRTALRFFIRDPRPGSPTATVTIRIVDGRDRLVKKAVLRGVKVDCIDNWIFTCWLARGSYRFSVAATDAAGNRQTAVGINTLVVRCSRRFGATSAESKLRR